MGMSRLIFPSLRYPIVQAPMAGGPSTPALAAAVDYAVAAGIADPARLGIGGWSYGGILTDYTIATDSRFKAAVSGAGGAWLPGGWL